MQLNARRLILTTTSALVLTALFAHIVSAQGNSAEILPRDDAVVGLLRGLELRAEPFPVAKGDWNESAGFTVPDERDVVIHTLVTYVAKLPSEADARDFYQSRSRQLELDNEMTHAWNPPRAESLGADETREFRIIYLDVASHSRSAEYARLMRRGPIVGLVEVVGSPEVDDQGQVDEGRRSILLGMTQLLMTRMAQQPIAPTNDAGAESAVSFALPARGQERD
ncbi:MAG TPA: hypothetical protein VHX16_05365 [Chloroflexota bacterium]|nr:hypothetical protein [Chloroflexota bacterium]